MNAIIGKTITFHLELKDVPKMWDGLIKNEKEFCQFRVIFLGKSQEMCIQVEPSHPVQATSTKPVTATNVSHDHKDQDIRSIKAGSGQGNGWNGHSRLYLFYKSELVLKNSLEDFSWLDGLWGKPIRRSMHPIKLSWRKKSRYWYTLSLKTAVI